MWCCGGGQIEIFFYPGPVFDYTGFVVTFPLLGPVTRTVSTTLGRGWTVTESPSGLSSTTEPGTLRPATPTSPGTRHRSWGYKRGKNQTFIGILVYFLLGRLAELCF